MRARALFEAMGGNFDSARALIAAALALVEQLGLEVDASGAQSDAAEIELLAGRLAEAERVLRLSVDALERRGDVGHLATVAPLLADVLYRQGLPDEAMPLTELVARSALADDLDPQVAWRRVQAKVLAQRGDFEHADRLAREAIARLRRRRTARAGDRGSRRRSSAYRTLAEALDARSAIHLHPESNLVAARADAEVLPRERG
jgi:tetratricopeptide (TPR) repeat protein